MTLVNVLTIKVAVFMDPALTAPPPSKSKKKKGEKSVPPKRKGTERTVEAETSHARTALSPVREEDAPISTCKEIPSGIDEAVEPTTAAPPTSCTPSSSSHADELLSAAQKAFSLLPKAPTTLLLSPVLEPLLPTPSLAPLSTQDTQPSELEYHGTLTPQTKLLKSVQAKKERLSEMANEYITDHFPILLDHPGPLSEVRRLLRLVFLKTSRWYEVRELVLVDTWTDLSNEETEVYNNFGIRNLWIAIQSLEQYIASFCRDNDVPLPMPAEQQHVPTSSHVKEAAVQTTDADKQLADSFLKDFHEEQLAQPFLAAEETIPHSNTDANTVEKVVEAPQHETTPAQEAEASSASPADTDKTELVSKGEERKKKEAQRQTRKRTASAAAGTTSSTTSAPQLSISGAIPKKPRTQLVTQPASVTPAAPALPNLRWHLVPKKIQPLVFKELLKTYAKHSLSKNDGDNDVPREDVHAWELLKKMFIKWYYGFSRLPKDDATASEVWKMFVYLYEDQAAVEKAKELTKDGKLSLKKVPPKRRISIPRNYSFDDLSVPLHELRVVAGIHGISKQENPVEFKELEASIYGLYNFRVPEENAPEN